MNNQKEMTAHNAPIGVGAEQSFQICSNDIITENSKDYKYNKFTVADCSEHRKCTAIHFQNT